MLLSNLIKHLIRCSRETSKNKSDMPPRRANLLRTWLLKTSSSWAWKTLLTMRSVKWPLCPYHLSLAKKLICRNVPFAWKEPAISSTEQSCPCLCMIRQHADQQAPCSPPCWHKPLWLHYCSSVSSCNPPDIPVMQVKPKGCSHLQDIDVQIALAISPSTYGCNRLQLSIPSLPWGTRASTETEKCMPRKP